MAESLREANINLLSRLHVAQKAIWRDMNSMKATRKSSVVDQPLKNSVFQGFGPNRSPVTLHSRRKAFSELSTKITPRKKSEEGSARNRLLADGKKDFNSILRTPQSQAKRRIQVRNCVEKMH